MLVEEVLELGRSMPAGKAGAHAAEQLSQSPRCLHIVAQLHEYVVVTPDRSWCARHHEWHQKCSKCYRALSMDASAFFIVGVKLLSGSDRE